MAAVGGTLMDFIKSVLDNGGLSHNGDSLGEMMPPDMGKPDNSILGPGLVDKNKKLQDCPNCIYNDQGDIVDYSIPKQGLVDKTKGALNGGNGEGTLSGFLNRLLSPTPERNVPGQVQGQGTVGGGNPDAGTPGTGIDPGLDPQLTQDQKVPGFRKSGTDIPTPMARPAEAPKADYSMIDMDPTSIEQLRQSLLTQQGQLDPANPNGLSGRMNSPLAPSDMGQQRNEAMGISDSLRGYDGARVAKIRAQRNGQ